MTMQLFQKQYGFENALFRRSGDINFYGSAAELFEQVQAYNEENDGTSRIVIHSYYEITSGTRCRINIGVYGNDMEKNKEVLNRFAVPLKTEEEEEHE